MTLFFYKVRPQLVLWRGVKKGMVVNATLIRETIRTVWWKTTAGRGRGGGG